MNEHQDKPTINNNFYGNIGQQIGNVEHMEVHFDKDMQMHVGHVEEMDACVGSQPSDSNAGRQRPAFEDAIPEELRIGKLFTVWVKLKGEGILDEDYLLAPDIPHTAANYLVTCFCAEGQNQWKAFEEFWNIPNLKDKKGAFGNTLKDKINAIFSKS